MQNMIHNVLQHTILNPHFEDEMSVSQMVCPFGYSQDMVEGQHFYQTTQNGTQTANVLLVNQKRTC